MVYYSCTKFIKYIAETNFYQGGLLNEKNNYFKFLFLCENTKLKI